MKSKNRQLLVILNGPLDSDAPWPLVSGASEFGDLHVVSLVLAENIDSDRVEVEQVAPSEPMRRYPDATFYSARANSLASCLLMVMSADNWLPRPHLVILGVSVGERAGVELWRSPQVQAALLAAELGAAVMTFSVAKGALRSSEIVGYAAERIIRATRCGADLQGQAVQVSAPRLRPNECEGFRFAAPTHVNDTMGIYLDRSVVPWSLRKPERDQVADENGVHSDRRILVTFLPSWCERDSSAQLLKVHTLATVVAQLGSSVAHRAAVERSLNADVEYTYHFKGALLSAHVSPSENHRASMQSLSIDEQLEAPILRFARGDVLDLGCGSGRVSVYLAAMYRDSVQRVVAVDSNASALDDLHRRWVEDNGVACEIKCMDLRTGALGSLGVFDTILLFGDTLGIPGTQAGVAELLRRIRSCSRRDAHLLVTGRDPDRMASRDELEIIRQNCDAGFPAGERHLRISFEGHDTGWFAWYYLGIAELRDVASRSGWRLLEDVIAFGEGEKFGAVLRAVE
jgi:SAM-dependent methyltransferase